ncbi:MAG: hypothetical protein AAGE84_04765 [Cyanobacteria bacterium P01_G01_bin.39]
MVLRLNGFSGMLFLTAAFGSLMNPPPYIAIAIFFFLMGLVLFRSERKPRPFMSDAARYCSPVVEKLIQQHFQRQIKGGIKSIIILTSLLIMCLIIPQVDTNTSRLFANPIANLKFDSQS